MPSKSKAKAMLFILMIFMLNALPPTYARVACTQPHPPSHGGPPTVSPPAPSPSGGGGGVSTLPPPQPSCPIDALKLGLCVDVLGGLVHVRIGNPVENICCPVIKGLLELEAAVCLCTVIRLKPLNLDKLIPLALHVLLTCGKPPSGFLCPPL